MDFSENLDLEAAVKALNTVLVNQELTKQDKLVLVQIRDILWQTLKEVDAMETLN